MPTGYTAKIYENKNVKFEDYVWECARGFGALAELRDTPNAKIPESFENRSFYARELQRVREEFSEYKTMSDEDIAVRVQEEYNEHKQHLEQYIQEKNDLRQRYNKMLDKSRNWVPPTNDHKELKNHMIIQLELSIDHDCNVEHTERELANLTVQTVENYKASKAMRFLEDVERYTDMAGQEQAAVKAKNKWLKDLRDSLI